ncbi:MAG: PilZ domain-containing protein [Candidatus Omnitrophica bacterium]|nr:PilZ domain-containing protein [Candidatus Omnitrophota bacterium]
MNKQSERREYPRIKDKEVGVKLSGAGFKTMSQSLDVSASGIYCKVDRRIPVMTRIQVILSLPGRTKTAPPIEMEIEGIVVREHLSRREGEKECYDVAIFFNALTPRERETLVDYINRKAKQDI